MATCQLVTSLGLRKGAWSALGKLSERCSPIPPGPPVPFTCWWWEVTFGGTGTHRTAADPQSTMRCSTATSDFLGDKWRGLFLGLSSSSVEFSRAASPSSIPLPAPTPSTPPGPALCQPHASWFLGYKENRSCLLHLRGSGWQQAISEQQAVRAVFGEHQEGSHLFWKRLSLHVHTGSSTSLLPFN